MYAISPKRGVALSECRPFSCNIQSTCFGFKKSPIEPERCSDCFKVPEVLERKNIPSKENWNENVLNSVHAIQSSDLEKIVLSRKSVLELSETLDPFELLSQLKQMSIDSFDFCFQPNENIAFLGSTPELLYRREGRTIASEAIAGTRPRGENEAEEKKYFEDLLNSKKDKEEHRVVFDRVHAILKTLCSQLRVIKKAEVLKLSLVQHLYSQFYGELKDSVNDAEILSELHPTPGVLGEPRKLAFEELKKREQNSRGWYAGPMGWIGNDEAIFVVGIRSGLLEGKKISLFSGAGIMKGSDPDEEWDEVENKIAHFLKILKYDEF